MREELYFNNELRKCLNAAGLSGSDAWNYWYQRVHKAHDQAIDGVTEVQRAENAELRELVNYFLRCERCLCDGCQLNKHGICLILDKAEELGFEVPE